LYNIPEPRQAAQESQLLRGTLRLAASQHEEEVPRESYSSARKRHCTARWHRRSDEPGIRQLGQQDFTDGPKCGKVFPI